MGTRGMQPPNTSKLDRNTRTSHLTGHGHHIVQTIGKGTNPNGGVTPTRNGDPTTPWPAAKCFVRIEAPCLAALCRQSASIPFTNSTNEASGAIKTSGARRQARRHIEQFDGDRSALLGLALVEARRPGRSTAQWPSNPPTIRCWTTCPATGNPCPKQPNQTLELTSLGPGSKASQQPNRPPPDRDPDSNSNRQCLNHKRRVDLDEPPPELGRRGRGHDRRWR